MRTLAESLKESLNRIRDLLQISRDRRSEHFYYHPCRIYVEEAEQRSKFRVTILVRAQNYMDAERQAESHLQELIRENGQRLGGDLTVRWLKARLIREHPRDAEPEIALQLLARLRRESRNVVSALQRVEAS